MGHGRVRRVASRRIAVRGAATLLMALCLPAGTAIAATPRILATFRPGRYP